MNIIKKIRLKVSNFFFPNAAIFYQPLINQFLPKNIERLQRLAGIIVPKTKFAMEKARIKAEEEEFALEYDKLRKNQRRVGEIKKWAVVEAARRLKNSELALATADAMEERNKRVKKENDTFDTAWTKYSKKNIKKRDPKAKDFAKFLVEDSYLDKKLLDEIAISAIFYDNKIYNFRQFRSELNRVKLLKAA